MYNLLSSKEKEKFFSTKDNEEINDLLVRYFHYYKIEESIMEEVDFIYLDIKKQIPSLIKYGITSEWCVLFEHFITTIVKECKNRLV